MCSLHLQAVLEGASCDTSRQQNRTFLTLVGVLKQSSKISQKQDATSKANAKLIKGPNMNTRSQEFKGVLSGNRAASSVSKTQDEHTSNTTSRKLLF